MNKNLPSRVLTGIAGLVESYGQDPNCIAHRVGLEPAALYAPDVMIDGALFNDFLEEAALACDDRFFALKLAPLQTLEVLGPVWQVVRRARTVGELFQLLARHLETHAQDSSSLLLEDPGGITVCYEVRLPFGGPRSAHGSRVQVVELGAAISCLELRRFLGNRWRPEYAQFRHSAPDDIKPLRQLFGENLQFNQDVNAFRICRADCELPITATRERASLSLPREALRELDLTVPFVLEVDRTIRLLLNRGKATLDEVAETLELSPRTLQHRLKQQQTSYQNLFDLARVDLALQYLNDSDLSVLAISERLGFTDTAAFSRFFKKHLKMSPREYSKRSG